MNRKGIILAGGSGTRLWPITMGVSKQLLPIYDKPMIYYPLSVLMLGGIREIAIITTPDDQSQFIRLLGDGSQWGLHLTYIVQPNPDGLAQAYLLARDFLAGAPSVLVLGDNIFFGHGLPEMLATAAAKPHGGTVFGYRVSDPERYGVVDFDADGNVRQIIEKPVKPPSNFAITGLYYLDARARPTLRRRSSHRRGGSLKLLICWNFIAPKGRWRLSAWGAALRGLTPVRMAVCWTRAISCALWKRVRACRWAAPMRLPIAAGGLIARHWRRGPRFSAKMITGGICWAFVKNRPAVWSAD